MINMDDISQPPSCLSSKRHCYSEPLCDRYLQKSPPKSPMKQCPSTHHHSEPPARSHHLIKLSSIKRLSVNIPATLFCFVMLYMANNQSSNYVSSLRNRYGKWSRCRSFCKLYGQSVSIASYRVRTKRRPPIIYHRLTSASIHTNHHDHLNSSLSSLSLHIDLTLQAQSQLLAQNHAKMLSANLALVCSCGTASSRKGSIWVPVRIGSCLVVAVIIMQLSR